MNKATVLLGAALGLALFVTGCETDGSSTRIQEKSAVYATLKPWEKNYIDKGVIALGFTPDMVYMAIGKPSTVDPVATPEGKGEKWTYKNYYPTPEAGALRYNLNSEQHYQPSNTEPSPTGGQMPRGMGGLGTGPQSIATTGGPQGG